MKKKNPVRGFPIILNKYAVTVIHVFTRHDCIEDVWMSDGNKMDGDWISAEMNGRECLYA